MCSKYIGLSNFTNNIQNHDSPRFNFCDFLLVKITEQDAECLQKLQNCALRTILRVDRLTPTAYTHETLNMCTLHELT